MNNQPQMMSIPRGVRNNNPGNIRHSTDKWEGLAETQADPAFCTFVSPEYGIRALVLTLLSYQDKHGLHTLAEMIDRWAPPNENRTDAYLIFVAGKMGVGPDDRLDLRAPGRAMAMARAIIAEECAGHVYPDTVLLAAMKMSGVQSA